MIFKKGGDLRKDMFSTVLFRLFNLFWQNSPFREEERPFIYTYKIMPLSSDLGIVEFVPNCEPTTNFDWKQLNNMSDTDRRQFILSAAGAYVTSWVLGIRDRHQDNMLIKDGTIFFNIDFEHIFNQKTKFNDAPRFAIHSKMKRYLEQQGEWEKFKNICAEAFLVLQNHSSIIIQICSYLFESSIYKDFQSMRQFLNASLMLDRSPKSSFQAIKILCEKGAASLFKHIKFMTHVFNINSKQKTNKDSEIDDEDENESDLNDSERKNSNRKKIKKTLSRKSEEKKIDRELDGSELEVVVVYEDKTKKRKKSDGMKKSKSGVYEKNQLQREKSGRKDPENETNGSNVHDDEDDSESDKKSKKKKKSKELTNGEKQKRKSKKKEKNKLTKSNEDIVEPNIPDSEEDKTKLIKSNEDIVEPNIPEKIEEEIKELEDIKEVVEPNSQENKEEIKETEKNKEIKENKVNNEKEGIENDRPIYVIVENVVEDKVN